MEATGQNNEKGTTQLQEEGGDRNEVEHDTWIVPAKFCAIRYINGWSIILVRKQQGWSVCYACQIYIVKFWPRRFPDGSSQFQCHCIMGIWALQNIDANEVLP